MALGFAAGTPRQRDSRPVLAGTQRACWGLEGGLEALGPEGVATMAGAPCWNSVTPNLVRVLTHLAQVYLSPGPTPSTPSAFPSGPGPLHSPAASSSVGQNPLLHSRTCQPTPLAPHDVPRPPQSSSEGAGLPGGSFHGGRERKRQG